MTDQTKSDSAEKIAGEMEPRGVQSMDSGVSMPELEKAIRDYGVACAEISRWSAARVANARAEVLRLASQGVRPSVNREALRRALTASAEGPIGIDGYCVSEVARALRALGIEVQP